MNDYLLVAVLCLLVGFFLIGLGLLGRAGGIKHMYMLTFNPERPVDIIYAAIPLGIGSILVSIAIFTRGAPISRILVIIAFTGGIIISFVLMAWKPRWLKPDWLQWLELNFDERTREFMVKQARKEGRAWHKRVAKEEGFRIWAEEMAQKYRPRIDNDKHWGMWDRS